MDIYEYFKRLTDAGLLPKTKSLFVSCLDNQWFFYYDESVFEEVGYFEFCAPNGLIKPTKNCTIKLI